MRYPRDPLSAEAHPNILRRALWNEHERRVRAPWRILLHTLALLVLVFSASLLSGLLELGPVGGLSAQGTVAFGLVVLLATWLIGRNFDRRELADFGLHLDRRWWADCGAGLLIGALLMAGVFALEHALGWLTIVDYQVGGGEQGFADALLGSAIAFVAVGFYEELLSRGYHLRNIAEGLSREGPAGSRGAITAGPAFSATMLSAALFGLMHAGNDNASIVSSLNVALAGCMLALPLLWTGELGLSIGLHISWNFCQGNVFGFPVSGNPMPVRVIAIAQAGDPLITGGAFGPEAGLIGIVAMLFGAALIAAWVRLTRGGVHLRLTP